MILRCYMLRRHAYAMRAATLLLLDVELRCRRLPPICCRYLRDYCFRRCCLMLMIFSRLQAMGTMHKCRRHIRHAAAATCYMRYCLYHITLLRHAAAYAYYDICYAELSRRHFVITISRCLDGCARIHIRVVATALLRRAREVMLRALCGHVVDDIDDWRHRARRVLFADEDE